MGRLGVHIDKVRLARLVSDARDTTSALFRAWSAAHAEPLELPLPLVVDEASAMASPLQIKDDLDRLPVDARLDLGKRELIPEVEGRLLDVDRSLMALRHTLQEGALVAPLVFETLAPKRRAAQLGNVEFGTVLGSFRTPYSRARRHMARTFNLRLAASKLDGYVLLPGEEFDFNEVVGPRDEAHGYKVAPVIAEGELVDGIGGGTCQISGTLHAAAFFSGLGIVERYPHTRPSSYIKLGLDATVVYPTINFRVRNPFDFPVVLHQIVKNGWVHAQVLGPKDPRTVTLIRRIDSALPYEEVERPDKDLPEGKRVLAQRGIPGFKLHRYRITRSGAHAVRERWNDVYPPTAQIVRVGTGESGRESKARDDAHGEYVVDELLTVTQSSDDKGDRRTREERQAGRFGDSGWTEKHGMPLWRSVDP